MRPEMAELLEGSHTEHPRVDVLGGAAWSHLLSKTAAGAWRR